MGLVCCLLKWLIPEILMNGAMSGGILEMIFYVFTLSMMETEE
jgi:hypothetical protein